MIIGYIYEEKNINHFLRVELLPLLRLLLLVLLFRDEEE